MSAKEQIIKLCSYYVLSGLGTAVTVYFTAMSTAAVYQIRRIPKGGNISRDKLIEETNKTKDWLLFCTVPISCAFGSWMMVTKTIPDCPLWIPVLCFSGSILISGAFFLRWPEIIRRIRKKPAPATSSSPQRKGLIGAAWNFINFKTIDSNYPITGIILYFVVYVTILSLALSKSASWILTQLPRVEQKIITKEKTFTDIKHKFPLNPAGKGAPSSSPAKFDASPQ